MYISYNILPAFKSSIITNIIFIIFFYVTKIYLSFSTSNIPPHLAHLYFNLKYFAILCL